jgi:hypothetical protein
MQVFFAVERSLADELAPRAADENPPLSQYLARLASDQVQTDWPEGYLSAVVGCRAADPLQEPDDEAPDEISLRYGSGSAFAG